FGQVPKLMAATPGGAFERCQPACVGTVALRGRSGHILWFSLKTQWRYGRVDDDSAAVGEVDRQPLRARAFMTDGTGFPHHAAAPFGPTWVEHFITPLKTVAFVHRPYRVRMRNRLSTVIDAAGL